MLFDFATLRTLKKVAKEKKSSVGKLVREAVKEKYLEDKKQLVRIKAIEETLRIRPTSSKPPIDYKELINNGRKY